MLNGTVIKHRELITKVVGGAFSQGLYKIQPGLPSTFPWLSQIAINFEMYELLNLQFQFISTRPATDAGIFYMAIDYDAADNSIFTDATQIMQMQGCVAGKIWDNLFLRFNPQNVRSNRNSFFTREFGVPDNTAIQDYDLGTLHYVTDGSGALSVGALYVEYTIKLKIPQPVMESPILIQSFQSKYTGVDVGTFTAYGRRLVSNSYLTSHVFSPSESIIAVDGLAEAYKYKGDTEQSYLYELRAIIDGTESLTNVQSFNTVLSTLDGATTAVLKDPVTLVPISGAKAVFQVIGSYYEVVQSAIITFNVIQNLVKIGTGLHNGIASTKMLYLNSRITPFAL